MNNNFSFTLSKSLLNLGSVVVFLVSYMPPAKATLLLVQTEVQVFDTHSRCVETVRKVLIKEGFERYAKRSDEVFTSSWVVELSTDGMITIGCTNKTADMGAFSLDKNADSSVMDNYQLLKKTLLDEAEQGKAPRPLNPSNALPLPPILVPQPK